MQAVGQSMQLFKIQCDKVNGMSKGSALTVKNARKHATGLNHLLQLWELSPQNDKYSNQNQFKTKIQVHNPQPVLMIIMIWMEHKANMQCIV